MYTMDHRHPCFTFTNLSYIWHISLLLLLLPPPLLQLLPPLLLRQAQTHLTAMKWGWGEMWRHWNQLKDRGLCVPCRLWLEGAAGTWTWATSMGGLPTCAKTKHPEILSFAAPTELRNSCLGTVSTWHRCRMNWVKLSLTGTGPKTERFQTSGKESGHL